MKIGQPKLSERQTQRNRLFVTSMKLAQGNSHKGEDWGLKESVTTGLSNEAQGR